MKTRIKNIIVEGSYLLPVIILDIMLIMKIPESDNERALFVILSIPICFCVGISSVRFIKEISEFRYYLKMRKEYRLTGLDICPKCRGVGWIDWIEKITGKKEVTSRNE